MNTLQHWADLKATLFLDGREGINSITFQDFLTRVATFSSLVHQIPQKNWVLFQEDIVDFSIAWLGLLHADKTVIIPPNNSSDTLKLLTNEATFNFGCQSQPLYFCTQAEQLHTLFEQAHACQSDLLSSTHAHETPLTLSEQAHTVFFTSGSTGYPKAIKKSWHQLTTEALQLESLWGSEQRQLFIGTVSHLHIYGLLFRLLWPLLSGKQIQTELIRYPETLIETLNLNRNKNVHWVSSPAFLQRLQATDWQQLEPFQNQLSHIFSSGGPLSFHTAHHCLNALKKAPIEVLGSTETGGIAHRQQHTEQQPWQTFPLVDARSGSNQRLEIRSQYLTPPEQWYVCDDRVQLLNENSFHLLGRVDRIIKLEEKRLSLDELELQLQQHSLVEECHILVLPGKRIQLGAAIVLNRQGKRYLSENGKLATNKLLRNMLSQRFEAVVIPRKWRYLDKMPYNSQGKRQHQQLLHVFAQEKRKPEPETDAGKPLNKT